LRERLPAQALLAVTLGDFQVEGLVRTGRLKA
jgi:hypothetical protein